MNSGDLNVSQESRWYEFARRTRLINESKKFETPDWKNFLGKDMLVVSELDECVQGCLPDGEKNAGEELADVAIRLMDVLQALWPDTWTVRPGLYNVQLPPPGMGLEVLEAMCWKIVHPLCQAAEFWRKNDRDNARIGLEVALAKTGHMAALLRVDLAEFVEKKLQKNATREVLHGKVNAV